MICRKTKMSLICLFSALSFITLSLTSVHAATCGNNLSEVGEECDGLSETACPGLCQLDCTCGIAPLLTVGRGSAKPEGATDSPLVVSMDNSGIAIAGGLTMHICDDDGFLSCTGCETTDRTDALGCQVNERPDGCCRVLLFSVSSSDIETGNGPIFTLLNTVSSTTNAGCSEVRIQVDDEHPLQIANAISQKNIDEPRLQAGGFCFPCISDADCDDGLYCTGVEKCANDVCEPGTNPCPSQGVCNEETNVCGQLSTTTTPGNNTTTTGPSSTTTTEPSSTTTGPATSTTTEPSTTTSGPSSTTTIIPGEPSMQVISEAAWKSRWVALPYLVVVEGTGTSFQAFRTTVAYDPRDAVLKLFPIVLGDNYIWDIVLIMPSWFAGEGDQTVRVTATTGSEVVDGDFLIQELPSIFEQE